jgi:hypothetical protein
LSGLGRRRREELVDERTHRLIGDEQD